MSNATPDGDDVAALIRDPVGFSRYFAQRHERRQEREALEELEALAAAQFLATPRLSPLAFRVRRLTGFTPHDRDVAAIIAEHRAAEERKRDGLEPLEVLPIG